MAENPYLGTMKTWVILALLLLGGAQVHGQLRKQRLFKVDPLSFVFKEFRVAIEHRMFKDKDYFWYLAPYGYHQYWRGKSNDAFDRPGFPQKYYGVGLRAGARRYFLPAGMSPHGFFVQAQVGARQLWLNNYNTDLQIVDRTRIFQVSAGGTVGYQIITGPRKDFAYGVMGGFELFGPPITPNGTGYDSVHMTSNWYEFPFLDKGHTGFRLYLGIEVGFAFLQKHLHW